MTHGAATTCMARRKTMPTRTLLWLTAMVLGAAWNASLVLAKDTSAEPSGLPVTCSELATNPALGLAGNPAIKTVTSTIIAASGQNKSYCQGVGGGGCAGSLIVTGPVNIGYVGSGTDTGHSG